MKTRPKLSILIFLITLLQLQAKPNYNSYKNINMDSENSFRSEIINVKESKRVVKYVDAKNKSSSIHDETKIENLNIISDILLQQIINGTVVDQDGNPLSGANILAKGTLIGTQSDFNGNFSIEVPNMNAILVISYIGFKTKEVALAGQTTISITLEEDASNLDEVILIGYGTQKRKDLTGAVATVTSEDMKSLTISNTTAALQGRAAGVNVQSSGSPGGQVNVVIRGAATINGSVAPLYVVDGLFLESLDAINSADITSIQILKDASAAAIYGSRAANGVVIVTTNKGSKGGLVVQGHATIGVSKTTNTLDFMNARQYADTRNTIADIQNSTRAPANSTAFDPNIDTDWQSLQLRNGLIQDYGFSFAGGGENSSMYFSANYYEEKGVLVSSGFNRINLRLNSEFWSKNKKFKLSQTLGLTQRDFDRNNFYGSNGYNIPTIPVRDSDGNFVAPNNLDNGVVFSTNRYAQALTYDDEYKVDEVFGNISPEIELIPGLKYKLNLGYSYSSDYSYLFVPTYFWSSSNPNQNYNTTADLSEGRSTIYDLLMDNTLSYDVKLGKSTLGMVLGNTIQKITRRGTVIQVNDFPSNDLRVVSAGIETTNRSGEEFVTGLQSFYWRLTYNFDDRYLLTSTVRQDKSSRFAEDFRTGIFPSISLGWRLSNENFFPENNVLTDLKLRASYGELGSQNVADYAYSSVMHLNSNYDFGDTRFFGVSRLKFNLPNLVWETSKTTNFGIDANLFGNNLTSTIDYYVRNTENILVSLPIPPSSGSASPTTTNAASIQNRGLELSLGYKKLESDFTYNVNFNISTLNNKVTSLGPLRAPIYGGQFSASAYYSTIAVVGEEVGALWGFETDGLYQSQEEIEADPNLASDPAGRSLLRPGDLIWKDQNGDGFINEEDKVNIGSPYPDFEFGLNFIANYKNFELTLFFQGQSGNQIFNARKFYTHFEPDRSNYATSLLNAWTTTNTNTSTPRVGTSRTAPSDWYVEDGSYVRLKQLRLGYNFNNLIEGVPQIKVFANAQNLLTFTKYSGYDPELGTSLFSRGVDDRVYPQIFQIMGGIEFTIK